MSENDLIKLKTDVERKQWELKRLESDINIKKEYLLEVNGVLTKAIIQRDTLLRFNSNLKFKLWFKLFLAKILGIEYELKHFKEVEEVKIIENASVI